MTEACGAAHPTDEALYCTRALPCFLQHQVWDFVDGAQRMVASWPNPAQPPARTPRRGGIKRPVVPEIPPSAGTPQQAWDGHREQSLDEGRRLRDEGIERVQRGDDEAAEQWKANFRQQFRALLASKREFYADDIIEVIGLPPAKEDGTPRSNLVGALFNAEVRRAGDGIEEVGRVQMTRASAHARKTSLWKGR